MCEAERELGVASFFMMDENFLLYKRRALELLERMKGRQGVVALRVLVGKRDPQVRHSGAGGARDRVDLARAGIGAGSYVKLKGADTLALARELQSHGIRVLGSTIVGLEHHTPENIGDEIDHAMAHDTVFHQFMLYTPVPGTPLHARCRRGTLSRTLTSRTFTGRSSSISGIRRSRATVEDVPRSAPSVSISSERPEPVPADAEHDDRLASL